MHFVFAFPSEYRVEWPPAYSPEYLFACEVHVQPPLSASIGILVTLHANEQKKATHTYTLAYNFDGDDGHVAVLFYSNGHIMDKVL